MGLWGDDGISLGGVFEGGISGGRIRLKINLPVLPDITLIDEPFGLRDGGRIGDDKRAQASARKLAEIQGRRGPTRGQAAEGRASASKATLDALQARSGPTREQAAERRRTGRPAARLISSDGREPALVSGSARRDAASGSPTVVGATGHVPVGAMAHPLGRTAPMRLRHEIRPGVPCPSCARGETYPLL